MKNEREKVDLLLEKNAAEQLAKVDWEGLNAAILSRLDQAGPIETSAIGFPTVFKIAAGVAAAAVILVALVVRTDKPSALRLPNGGTAVVNFIEAKGSASIEIVGTSEGRGKSSTRAAWIIISRPEPMYADNGESRDTMDLICLF